MFRTDGNIIYFNGEQKGGVTGDTLKVLAALHGIVKKQGYEDVTLDFSHAGFIQPSFLVPLATVCRAYRKEKIDFDLVMPAEAKTAALMSNANWAHLISPEKYVARDEFNKHHLSALQFMSAEEHHAAVDRCVALLLQTLVGIDRKRIKALEWALNEITDNVLNHAESHVGGVVQVVNNARHHCVELHVCDAGITIPRSLRTGRPDLTDDTSALRAAIEEGVTKNTKTNQGNGLFGTFKCCEVSGGEFEVMSGRSGLIFRPGDLRVLQNAIPFPGTYVRASIKYDYERLLEDALVFKGRVHDPQFDYVERTYFGENEEIEFAVAKELNAFGSREAGRVARTKIENLMDRGKARIAFDFEDIHLISSSFADEVFGKLFAQLGPVKFNDLCRFRNVDSTVRGLIDRAIMQRLSLSA
ncbi:MAG TPA: STAS-like domain-containing protein [Caulobacteraceae bacterium]|jgi:anti-sigma regulatory factor (Ser/Thr protein kinase)|nr:STAS-like domain-containing protein [Caulobacteraceae bacterium]